jgi:3-phenylpropionate/cinnamic acid dioxygenase small subunit
MKEILLARLLLEREIENVLFAEADLLDERRFEEWLGMLTDDFLYFVPISHNVRFGQWDKEYSQEGVDISWFEEGRETIELRVRQFLTGQHWSEEPVSRVSHFVTNIRLMEVTPSDRAPVEARVRCRFLVYRNRLEDATDLFAGKREDMLRRVDGKWMICGRRAYLDQNTLLAQTMPIFI